MFIILFLSIKFFQLEYKFSVLWKDKIKATLKRLHNLDARIDGAYVDLLIKEQNTLR